MKTLFGKTLTEIAIERLRIFEDAALAKSPDGYYVAYSGGKDSDIILDLVRRSGVKYTAHYQVTTCDPPELIKHISKQIDVRFEKAPLTMWALIKKKGLAPTRNRRFCCEVLKERGGDNRIVVTGVRWAESTRRGNRRMFETCYRKRNKQFLNPIIDWNTMEVWSYIKSQKLTICSLYSEGWKRLGCVLCPMARNVVKEMERWPRIASLWKKAIIESHQKRPSSRFRTGEDYWQWWIARDAQMPDDDQIMMFTD